VEVAVSHVEQSGGDRGGRDLAAPEPEPSGSHARATGGILGAMAAELRLGGPRPTPAGPRSLSGGLVDLAQAFASRNGQGTPLDVAAQLRDLDSPAWLLSVAIVRPRSDALGADALRLANAAGVPGHALPHCVGYVELCAALFGGMSDAEAIEHVTGQRARGHLSTALTLCSDPHLDALTTGIWALQQRGTFAEVLGALASLAPPAIAAAAGGLLGLRDGVAAVPVAWHTDLPVAGCATLAEELVRVRHGAFLTPTPRGRPLATVPAGPGRIAAATSGVGSAWGWTDRQ
jgi:hypothetical protein